MKTIAQVLPALARPRGPWGGAAAVAISFATAASAALLVTGCAEEDAEGFDAAYPVGTTAPPPAPRGPQARATAQRVPAEPPGLPPSPDRPPDPAQDADDVATENGESPPDGPAPAYEPERHSQSNGPGDAPADTDPSALTDFHAALDPYGRWVDDPTYGTVWVPSSSAVGPDFTPYSSAGHWSYDDGSASGDANENVEDSTNQSANEYPDQYASEYANQYTWVSDYGWGWAPFHYGRWVYGGPVGWEWIPGRRYAGAWVSWRYGWDDWPYVGWAPLSPTWGWRGGRAVGLGFVPAAPYAFVSSGDLFARQVSTRVVAGSRAAVVAAHTRPWTGSTAGTPGASSGVALGGAASRVPAHPGVAIGGPPPSALGIPQEAVVRTANRGVLQARAFARSGGPAPALQARTIAPAYGPPATSHFGGRLGAGFTGNVAASGPMRGSAATGPRPYFAPSTSSAASARAYREGAAPYGAYGAGRLTGTGGRPGTGQGYPGRATTTLGTNGRTEGAYFGGGFRGGAGTVHVGGGGGGGAPEPSPGGFQGGGGGGMGGAAPQSPGGFHGGGGGGGGFHGGGGGFQGGGGFHGGGSRAGGGGRGGHR